MDDLKQKRVLKPWHGIITLVLAAICIFYISGYLSYYFGLYGTLMNEIMLLLLAVGTVLVFKGDLRRVFPLHKPKAAPLIGTIIFWMGCFGAIMIASLFITVFFPEEMLGTGQSLGGYFTSVPFIVSFIIVSISPAICEEAVFRGVVLNSLSGSMNKWAAIIITGVVFGLMHGSVWRFMQTAVLGIAMGYIVYETGNILYSVLFHAVNNACPVILLYGMQWIYSAAGMEELLSESASAGTELPVGAVGIYLVFGGVAAFFIYAGSHLMHQGQPGYPGTLFAREKKKQIIALIVIAVGCVVIGTAIFGISLSTSPEWMQELIESVYGQDI